MEDIDNPLAYVDVVVGGKRENKGIVPVQKSIKQYIKQLENQYGEVYIDSIASIGNHNSVDIYFEAY